MANQVTLKVVHVMFLVGLLATSGSRDYVLTSKKDGQERRCGGAVDLLYRLSLLCYPLVSDVEAS